MTIKVKGKEYNLKFGYKSFKKSGILKEVIAMRSMAHGGTGNGAVEASEDNIEILETVFDLNSKLVLAALQKNHEEFRADYENPGSVQEAIDRIDDLMDDYMDEEDSMSIVDLFNALTEELFNNGFLSKKSEKLEDAAEKLDAPVIPIDHKLAEN